MQEVILVVPCYNEAERFDSGGFADFLAEQPGYALLFVDDGSSDRTPERLEALRKRQPGQVSVLRLEANSGKGEAVRRGMQTALAAGAPFTGFWDADLATPLCAAVAMRREFEPEAAGLRHAMRRKTFPARDSGGAFRRAVHNPLAVRRRTLRPVSEALRARCRDAPYLRTSAGRLARRAGFDAAAAHGAAYPS